MQTSSRLDGTEAPPETLGAHNAATFLPITNHSPDLGSR